MIISNMTLLIFFCIFLMITLSIIYFSKQRLNNEENKIYKIMLVSNIAGLFLQFLCDFVSYKYNVISPIISNIILKLYLVSFIIWINLILIYLLVITHKDKTRKIKKIMFIASILETLITLILPYTLYRNVELRIYYTTGSAIDFVYVVSLAIMIFIIVTIVKTWKQNDKKKIMPIIAFVILGISISIIQIKHPELVVLTPVESLICFIMYFTIENPDVKMIQQLEAARDQADKANRAKTDFLSNMSHEIRTPLNAIVGFSDCITQANELSEAKENAKDIINASNTLLEIVNGILDISKIEAGKLEITNSPYNAKSTFEDLAKLIKPKMQEKALDFTYYIAPDLPNTLYGDHANIKKIVTNLLSNAAKYTDKGFVRYEVNCINAENATKLIISVEDSGRGIKKENVDKLFTKFQRLEEDRNTTIEGTGLGLAITKQLTELMGGKIIVHTVYGEGSKFTIVLTQPISTTKVKAVEEKPNTTLDLKGVKILVVDDNTLNLKVATKLLERYNADNITCLDSGFSCLEKINEGQTYDLILLDDMMPKMSGIETLKKLKENRNFKTPVIALTANAITGMREKYLSDGFNEYLAKPIEKEDLVKVINSVLSNKEIEKNISAIEESPNSTNPREEISSKDTTNVENSDKNQTFNFNITSKDSSINNESNTKNQEQKTIFSFPNDKINIEKASLEITNTDDAESNQKQTTEKENSNEQEQQEEKNIFNIFSHKEEKDENKVKENHEELSEIIPVEDNIEEILKDTQKLVSEKKEETENNEVASPSNNTKENNKLKEKEKFLRHKGVDLDKALELLGDMEMYDMTIKDFYDTADTKWLKIMNYKNTNDLESYAIEVHSLKSDSKYLGFVKLSEQAYQHELKSKEKDEEYVRKNFADLEFEYNKVMSLIDEYNSLNNDKFTLDDIPH